MRSLSLRRILELTAESATEILSSKSSEAAMDFLSWGSDRTMNTKKRAYAFLDFGFRETDDSGFLPAEGESATFWATCLRELIEEAARICIPFLPAGILMGSSESRRARLIGDGPGRLSKVNWDRWTEKQRRTYGTSTFFGPLLAGTWRDRVGDRKRAIRDEMHLAARLPGTVGILLGTIGIRFHWR